MNQGSPFQISLKLRTGLDREICASGLFATALYVDERPECRGPLLQFKEKTDEPERLEP